MQRYRWPISSLASAPRAALQASLAVAFLGGCSPGSGLPPVASYNGTVYRLGVGDRVRLITYGEQQLSTDYRVSDSGAIEVPLLGSVHADGLTSTQLAAKVADDLKSRNLLRNPSVSVEVIAFRPISVLGEVAKPGEYPYEPGMTLLTAVAAAGGFTYRSVEDRAYVVRQVNAQPTIGKITPQDYVKPGDVIKIYERYF